MDRWLAKMDAFPFAEEKSRESDSESEEDLEPWDQEETECPLRLQEAVPDPVGSGSEVIGEGVRTPEKSLQPQEGSEVQDGEGNTIIETRVCERGKQGLSCRK